MSRRSRSIEVLLDLQSGRYQAGLDLADRATRGFASRASQSLGGVSQAFSGLTGVSGGTALAIGAVAAAGAAAAVALAKLGAAASSAARETELAFAEVQTIADESAFPLDRIQTISRTLAASFGTEVTSQAKALYQTISAGATSAAAAVDTLQAANTLAVGGLTDIETAVDGLTSVTNAYAASALSAGEASDAIFTAVRLGKTTVEELSGAIGQVAPIAATAGLTFDELAGAIATITTNGVSTAEAVTQVRSLLQSLIAPKAKAAQAARDLGIEWNLAALRSQGLAGFLETIRDSGATEAQLAALTGRVEGLSAVLNLSSQGGAKLAEVLGDFADKAGAAADAAEIIGSTTQKRIEEISALGGVILDRIGTFINESVIVTAPLTLARDVLRGLALMTGAIEDSNQALEELNETARAGPDVAAGLENEAKARAAVARAARQQADAAQAAADAVRGVEASLFRETASPFDALLLDIEDFNRQTSALLDDLAATQGADVASRRAADVQFFFDRALSSRVSEAAEKTFQQALGDVDFAAVADRIEFEGDVVAVRDAIVSRLEELFEFDAQQLERSVGSVDQLVDEYLAKADEAFDRIDAARTANTLGDINQVGQSLLGLGEDITGGIGDVERGRLDAKIEALREEEELDRRRLEQGKLTEEQFIRNQKRRAAEEKRLNDEFRRNAKERFDVQKAFAIASIALDTGIGIGKRLAVGDIAGAVAIGIAGTGAAIAAAAQQFGGGPSIAGGGAASAPALNTGSDDLDFGGGRGRGIDEAPRETFVVIGEAGLDEIIDRIEERGRRDGRVTVVQGV